MQDEQQFQQQAGRTLSELYKALTAAADEHGFDADLGPALTIEFEEPPTKFVVSPNAPVKQIWLSAHFKSYKFGWDEGRNDFVLPETSETLREVVSTAVSKQIGETITL